MKTYYWLVQNRLLSHLRFTSVLVLASFAFLSNARAQLPTPTPDGGYPNANTAEGEEALFNLTTGVDNTAVGFNSLKNNTTGGYNTGTGAAALFKNTTGVDNTAVGFDSLKNNTTGGYNTGTGAAALFKNITGSQNAANGAFALVNNSSGNNNTANGMLALQANTIGNNNTADGWQALASNVSGIQNTATGAEALQHNTTGNSNTANGVGALKANTTSFGNTATGFVALFATTTGGGNLANGAGALQTNTTGYGNVASGFQALMNNTTGNSNTANGFQALANDTTGSHNIAVGTSAGFNVTTASNVICIGDGLLGMNVSNSCYIGHIFGATAAGGSAVFIDVNGKLGTVTSSRRFKQDIKPIGKASEALFSLKPVIFRYKREIDPAAIQQFGLVAEDVEKVDADLIVRDNKGKPYSVRYDQINAMLLNEFLKEHTKVEGQNRRIHEQEATIAQLEFAVAKQQKGMELLAARLKEQDSKIEKVNAQLKLSKSSPQTVLNNQ